MLEPGQQAIKNAFQNKTLRMQKKKEKKNEKKKKKKKKKPKRKEKKKVICCTTAAIPKQVVPILEDQLYGH